VPLTQIVPFGVNTRWHAVNPIQLVVFVSAAGTIPLPLLTLKSLERANHTIAADALPR